MTNLLESNPDLVTAIDLTDKWIARRVHQQHQPGLAVGIVHAGDLLWGKCYGVANIERAEPVTLDTRFRIASITKTFTAVAILQLCETDKLRLDDPVSQYLDWFTLRYEGAPPITIRHLLTHTSGLPRDATTAHWTEHHFQSWAELVETTLSRKPTMPPLHDYSYSNLGYSLLGGIIEQVSGEGWADYIYRHILAPLGMTDTLVTPTGDEPRLAQGYFVAGEDYTRRTAPFVATGGFSASASMASSVNDLVKYMRFHMSGTDSPVLSAHSLRDMHRVHWLNKDWQGGYGLGMGTWRIGDWTLIGHSGGYQGYLTIFSLCRDHPFGVIVLTNSIDSNPLQYAERVYKSVLPEVLKVTQAAMPDSDPAWQKYVGTYHMDWGESEIVIRNKQLQMVNLDLLDMPPIVFEPTGEPGVFKINAPGNPGETARFELDADGKVVRLWVRNEYILPKR